MSTVKRSTTPNKQRSRSQSQQKHRTQEDVYVRTSLPPLVEGPVYANLICHIPKLQWNTKNQSLARYVNIKISWWGEEDTLAVFKPQVVGSPTSLTHQLSTTGKYFVRSELKQFARYLTDAVELTLKIYDSESNRYLGTAKVPNLSTLTINNPIKGYHSIFTNKGDKLGEVFVSLRLYLPGTHDSNENLAALSVNSDASNPPSRRNSFGANDSYSNEQFDRFTHIENLNSNHLNDNSTKEKQYDSTTSVKIQSGTQMNKDLPTGNVIEALIQRANRLREDMIKSSSQQPTAISKNNNSEISSNHSRKNSIDIIDDNIDHDNVCDILGIKPSDNLNNSNESILSDFDGLENEQSLLDDLLFGGEHAMNPNENHSKLKIDRSNKKHPRGKPPTGRSPSPSLSRVGGLLNRSHSARSRSVGQSSDSDTASRVSFDLPSSDIDDSENEYHDENNLCRERIQLLTYIRTARVRIDNLRLNILSNGRESPSHSSFGRTNKSKRALNYFIEYQFPVIANSRDGQKNEATQVMKIASKRFEHNNDITFSHTSTYPCLFNETTLKNWWRSLLIFKISSRISGSASPEQIGFAVLPLRHILKAENLHFAQNLNVIDRTQMPQQKISKKLAKKFSIGQLYVIIELDSDENNFKLELDRVRLIEQNKPKSNQRKGKIKKSKLKSKQILVNPNNNLQLPKAFSSEGFLPNESTLDLNDGFVVQIYLSITSARNIPQITNNNNLPRNPYFVCRAFWNEQPVTSIVCWGSTSPIFNFEQKMPILLTKSTIEKMQRNFVVIEVWDKKVSGSTDTIIGIVKIPLDEFYSSFKDKQISRVLLRKQYPVISPDTWLPIIDPFKTKNQLNGEIRVMLAMGTSDQITAVQVVHAKNQTIHPTTNINQTMTTSTNEQSTLIEHNFEIIIESINGLRAFESMVWGESDCFIQYLFPFQQEQNQNMTHIHSIKPFQLRTIRTSTTLCTSDPTFQDTHKFRYIISSSDVLHKYFYAACQSSSTIDTSIPFEVWSRFYYPNTRDQLLAKGKLPAAKLCSMTTMINSDTDNKSTQSFRIPLEIVRDDRKHPQQYHSSSYGGDLLLTVTYKRHNIKKNEREALVDRIANQHSQVCLSIGIIRACGLKHAVQLLSRHDGRLNYPAQVGVNSYVKLSLSFLSETEFRTTRTVARSFVPEFNHSIDFPIPLIWNDNRNHTVSLAEILEHGQLKIDVYHQMTKSDDSNQTNDTKLIDIHLCYCTIPLKDLISRHTGIKGWFSLASGNRMVTSERSSDPSEHCVGGLELNIRFGQQDDRRHVIDSAKALGWFDDDYQDEENFLDDQKDLGCLITISIDRIQFPISLATRPGKDRIDDRTNIFVQYRLYDKMPIITKRKKPIINKNNVICELKFSKEHLFLCSAPFLWYLREEKLELQIWTSENDSYDYSETLSSTDKFIGSVYIDLNPLCDRKRKSHRLSTVLPIFKNGTKDLGGGFAQIHVTIDKSKDFNELRNRTDIQTNNDAELESYLENCHTNLTNNDQKLRTITNNIFSAIINIEQAAHLSTVYSKQENGHISPNPYVTYSVANSDHLYRTPVLLSTSKPIWNYQQGVKLSIEYLFNDKKMFILKVWHKINADIETIPEKSGDKVLGFVSIDLSPLLSGLRNISGWYNIVDPIGNIHGQLKISIVPQEDLLELKRFKYHTNQIKLDSHRSTSTNGDIRSSRISSDLSARSNPTNQIITNLPIGEDDNNKKSFLMNNLQRQLSELGAITDRLKARLYSGTDTNSTARDSSSTIMTTARCNSVPPQTNITPLNLQINSNHQDVDTSRSSSTTIQTKLLEHFPESLSGRPLMSNGLNVTDVLSFHNEQIRVAQQLMTKANNLLESSKDLFNKEPSSSPQLPIISTMNDFEKRITPSSSPPPDLPNFNSTTEFRNSEILSSFPTKNDDEHILANSSEEKHIQPQYASIMSSYDEDNEHDETYLPIGLPPISNRINTPIINLPENIEQNPIDHNEQENNIEIDNVHQLDQFSTDDIDYPPTNFEPIHDDSSPKLSSRRNIFSTEPINDEQQEQIISSSSSSSTSEEKSSTSDTSIIETNNYKQSKQYHVPSSISDNHQTIAKRPSTRSPHLAFLDRRLLPNTFLTTCELEASMKHTSQAAKSENTPSTIIIERFRTKSSKDLLRRVSPLDGKLAQQSDTSTVDVTRLEKIFKTKCTTNN